MKWKAKLHPKEGDVKYCTIFPLIPKLIGDTWYWLESVDVKYIYLPKTIYDSVVKCEYETLKWQLVGLDDRP